MADYSGAGRAPLRMGFGLLRAQRDVGHQSMHGTKEGPDQELSLPQLSVGHHEPASRCGSNGQGVLKSVGLALRGVGTGGCSPPKEIPH